MVRAHNEERQALQTRFAGNPETLKEAFALLDDAECVEESVRDSAETLTLFASEHNWTSAGAEAQKIQTLLSDIQTKRAALEAMKQPAAPGK